MRCPPFCPIDHKNEYQPLSGPSRSSHNGRHRTAVAPYPSQTIHGSLGMIPRNPPVGTHLSANNHPSGGIQRTPLGFAPSIQPPPKPIRTFTPNWREPKRPPPPRDDPQSYEIPLSMSTAQFIACRSIHWQLMFTSAATSILVNNRGDRPSAAPYPSTSSSPWYVDCTVRRLSTY